MVYAAEYDIWLLIKLTLKGVVLSSFSFLASMVRKLTRHRQIQTQTDTDTDIYRHRQKIRKLTYG